jgi:hypothetical protein
LSHLQGYELAEHIDPVRDPHDERMSENQERPAGLRKTQNIGRHSAAS